MIDRRQFMGRSLALLGAGGLGALAGAEAERGGNAEAETLSPTALSQRAGQSVAGEHCPVRRGPPGGDPHPGAGPGDVRGARRDRAETDRRSRRRCNS